MKLALRLALTLAALAPLAAADSIRLVDGTRIGGVATDYDSASETLSWKDDAGVVRQLRLAQLDPASAYRVLKAQVPNDRGPGQLRLANFARDIGYYAHAARHYDYAVKADPSLADQVEAERAELRTRAAAWAMDRAREAIDKKDLSEAERWLRKIIEKLPDEPQATEAQDMIDTYYERVRAERTARVEAEAADHLKAGLAKAKSAYDDMLAANRTALTASKGGSKSVQQWEKGIDLGERALREIDAFQEKTPEVDAGLMDEYRQAVRTQQTEVYLSLANHWATRGSYNKALSQVNAVLAYDGKNEQALSMRNRIQDNANRGLRWFW